MNRILIVLREEYRRHVLRKQFIGVLLFPLILIAVATVIGYIAGASAAGVNSGVVGYVDANNALASTKLDGNSDLSFKPYPNKAAATADLEQGKLILVYVLDPDFVSNRKIEALYWKNEPSDDVEDAFRAAIRAGLTTDIAPDVRLRLLEGVSVNFATADGRRSFGENSIASIVLPIIIGLLIVIAVMFGSQYLVQAIVEEKENRTIEVIVSSLTPFQLMAGKILGLSAVVLTQVVAWAVGGVLSYVALRSRFAFLSDISIEPVFLITIGLLFIFQFVLYAAIMAAIGSAVTELKQAQSIAAPFTLLAISPEFFLPALLISPNGTIAVILSLIPFTSPFTLAFRYGMTSVPVWQMGVAVLLMIVTAVVGIWIASRIFHVGILRYGKAVPLSELFNAIRM
jgi:ABC-2 type transport system permease protein